MINHCMQLANLYIQLYTIHKIFVKKNPEAFSMTFFLTSGQIGLILKSSVINLGTLLVNVHRGRIVEATPVNSYNVFSVSESLYLDLH